MAGTSELRLTRGLATLALALLGACSSGASLHGGAQDASLQQVAPGVYVHLGRLEDWGPANQGDVANSGFIIGSRCVAVIDPGGGAAPAQRLLEQVQRTTPLPICYVINTHAHPDHVLGNSVLADAPRAAGAEFVGHHKLPAALQARAPYYLNALRRDFGAEHATAVRIVVPTRRVEGLLQLDLGDRLITLQAWPTAHTDADLTVLDERTRTLFLGDLLFVKHTPVVDGRLKGWLAVLGQLRDASVAHAVPGHGAVSTDWPRALDAEQHYLLQLQADVRHALKQGLTLSQAVERIAPDRPDWLLLDVFHRRNVTAAYAELEWE